MPQLSSSSNTTLTVGNNRTSNAAIPDNAWWADVLRFPQQGKVFSRIAWRFAGGWFAIVLVGVLLFRLPFGGIILSVACLGVPGAVVAAFLVGGWYWGQQMRQLMDFPTMEVAQDPVTPGDALQLTYRHTFKKPFTLDDVSLELILREWVEYTEGTDTKTDTHEVIIDTHMIPLLEVAADVPLEHRFTLTLPAHAMPTWTQDSNRISWLIRLKVNLPGNFDYNEQFNLTVVPKG
ncbi:MAG: hypothetical protein ACOYL5_07210 [Phototrophicaceae bacterium]|jgi:hypothetical protein